MKKGLETVRQRSTLSGSKRKLEALENEEEQEFQEHKSSAAEQLADGVEAIGTELVTIHREATRLNTLVQQQNNSLDDVVAAVEGGQGGR